MRMVLLKGYDTDGFRFFTNYNSRKAIELVHVIMYTTLISFMGLQPITFTQNHCLNAHSCIGTYSYSCFNPLSNERKSMDKSGDSHAVLNMGLNLKILKMSPSYLPDVIYGEHCAPD